MNSDDVQFIVACTFLCRDWVGVKCTVVQDRKECFAFQCYVKRTNEDPKGEGGGVGA
jgi:hypothetical protein